MKLVQNKIDDLNLELTIEVSKEDYAESKKKKINDYRKKADIKGFRKGMVPMSRKTISRFSASRFRLLIHRTTSGMTATSLHSSSTWPSIQRFHSSFQRRMRSSIIPSP